MKKLLSICTAAAIVAACTGGTPTKVENENCNCLICEASDSLNYYAKLDSIAWDSTWIYPHSENFDEWYDSLTVLVYNHLYNDGEYWDYYPTDELLHNKKFMKVMDNGFDGLCGVEDTTGCISYFYGAYNYYNK